MDPDANPGIPPTTTIQCLPAELLSHIFSYLNSPAPSDQRLHDQPHVHMLGRSPDDPQFQTLKHVSLVSHQWRAVVLPLLFRHAVWSFDRLDLSQAQASHLSSSSSSSSSSSAAIPLLSFLRQNSLTSYVESLTLITTDTRRKDPTSPTAAVGDIGTYRRGDGSGHYGYSPEPLSPLPPPSPRLVRAPGGSERDLVFNEDSNWLWGLLFDDAGGLDPSRFTIIAPPRMLASLLARMLFLGDEWSFGPNHHVLSLSRDDVGKPKGTIAGAGTVDAWTERTEGEPPAVTSMPAAQTPTSRPTSSSSSFLARPRPTPCALFTIRPWTALLLNEGSSTRVYKTYEYFHKRPPSLLGALLGAEPSPNDVPLLPATVRSLSYVGIFPLSSHVHTLVAFLPRVERLFLQLVPRNEILQDRAEMEHLDMDDLWAERNAAYAQVMRKMMVGEEEEEEEVEEDEGVGNWRFLKEFESGDAADAESWELAVGLVEAREEVTGWRVERQGVFVRGKRPRDR